MRIAVDGRELLGQPRGVGRFLGELLAVWSASRDFPHQLVLVLPGEPAALTCPLPVGVEVHRTPTGLLPYSTWWEQVVLPRAVEQVAADLLFAPGYTQPLRCRRPTVLGLHDLSFEVHPEWFGTREGIRRRLLTRLSAARAGRVVTGSQFAAREIQRLYGVEPARLVVAPYGVSRRFRPRSSEETSRLAESLGVSGPLVLAVGTLLERRYPARLLGAFAKVLPRHPGTTLLFVGEDRRRDQPALSTLAAELGVSHAVRLCDHIPESELPSLYSLARVVVYLSSYEGFGLPPLEALACGSQVVASAVPALVEQKIAGATLVDERSPASVTTALDRVLGSAPGPRESPAWTERLSWEATAASVQQALEQAA